MGLLGRIFGGKRDGDKGDVSTSRGDGGISNRDLSQAIEAAEDDPAGILQARLMIEQMGDQLSNAERAEAYRRLSGAPRYRNQRDNTKGPDSTCNFTAMAMAFEGLGLDYGEERTGVQSEEALYKRFYAKGMGSRVDEDDRKTLARDQGLGVVHLETPAFSGANDARKWFLDNVLPRLQEGAQGTLGVRSGSFRHVVRLQWVEATGLRLDDPWGQAVGDKDGNFGYAKKNDAPGEGQRKVGEDQAGAGDDCFLPWATVANVLSDRYVQLYTASASGVARRAGGK